MTLEEVEAELRSTEEQMKPLAARWEQLNRERLRLKSVAFIEANGVRREEVEMSSGDGKPYFSTVWEFAKWMKANKVTKRFCEWNQRIYFTAEIILGRMDPEAPATICDLTAESKVGARS